MMDRGFTRPAAGGALGDEPRRMRMLKQHHRKTLWVYWLLILLGFWTMLAPVSFGYGSGVVEPAGGRTIWLGVEARVSVLTWSDVVSGLLLVIFGWRALKPNRPLSLWAACFVGVWLSFAPLVFWAPSAVIYLNDTLVGVLVIALTILIPGMPNMVHYMKMGHEKTPGWTYNPSSWPQRWIMIALGFAGWIVSRYLAMFQLGYIDHVWEPFFGESSRLVLTSSLSRSLPISDGGLGALAYTFEFLMGWMGSPSRWRTMPWMVTFFGILVIPLGLVHILLVASQPIVVGHWCTLCLLAAAIMLPMIPLEVDEVVAMGQFLRLSRREGKGLWRTFWKGGIIEGVGPDEQQPEISIFADKPARVLRASVRGMSVPWTLAVSAGLGLWLMASPGVIGVWGSMADVEHALGALAVVIAVVAMGEVVRIGRLLNILVGASLAVLPWLLEGTSILGAIFDTLVGISLLALALPRGPRTESYGSWDRFIR
jgi:hypothetical protein